MPPLDAYALRSPTGGRAFALRALIGLTGEGSANRTTWVHVAYAGEWNGHPDGAFTLDDAAFRSCIRAFESQSNPIKCDYEHSSVSDTRGEPAPSSGYIQKLELRSDGLYALVEFTERAAGLIRGGEYRYCSGVFVFEHPDRKSGKPVECFLHSLALTDTPFIDGQKPIVLSQRRVALRSGGAMKIKRDALMELLDKIEGDEIEAEQLHAAVEAAAATAVAVEGAPEESESAEMADMPGEPPEEEDPDAPALSDAPAVAAGDDAPADAPALADDPAALLAQFEEVAAMMNTDVAGLLAMLREQAAASADSENPAALAAQVPALKATVATLSQRIKVFEDAEAAKVAAKAKADAEAKAKAIEAEVDGHVKSGLFRLADKPKFLKLAQKDVGTYREIVSALTPAVKLGTEAAGETAPPSGVESIDMNDANVVALKNHLSAYGFSKEVIDQKVTAHFTGRAIPRTAAG